MKEEKFGIKALACFLKKIKKNKKNYNVTYYFKTNLGEVQASIISISVENQAISSHSFGHFCLSNYQDKVVSFVAFLILYLVVHQINLVRAYYLVTTFCTLSYHSQLLLMTHSERLDFCHLSIKNYYGNSI